MQEKANLWKHLSLKYFWLRSIFLFKKILKSAWQKETGGLYCNNSEDILDWISMRSASTQYR